MHSPFFVSGARLRDNGISVLPIRPDGKMPGAYSSGEWRAMFDWQRFCDRMPTGFEMQVWEKWPAAGVGVALGPASGGAPDVQLVAADIDSEDPAVVAALMSVLGPSPVRKRGRKGECLFYKAGPAVVSRAFNDAAGSRLLDLLAKGRQTVLPPSIHPDTGFPYVWLTEDTLDSFDVADLPELPADIEDRLAEALKPFGYLPPLISALDPDVSPAESVHRALNERALANLEAWVPALQLYNVKRSHEGYKAVAHWRPSSTSRPLSSRARNLIIRHDGIKDMGESKGYTPLDLVMAACGAELEVAFKWLSDQVMPAAEVIQLRPREKAPPEPEKPPQAAEEPALLDYDPAPALSLLAAIQRRQAEAAAKLAAEHEIEVEEALAVRHEPPPAGIIPADLLRPPGLLGDVVDWLTAGSPKPSRALNLGAALAFCGAIMGRRYASPTKARTNVYCVGLGMTGFGKSYPVLGISSLMLAAGLHSYKGGERIKSDAGLLKMLETKPAALCQIDEMGGFMKKILDRRAATHDARVRELLLTLFSRANSVYDGTEGATERAVLLYNPHLCLFGASTPDDFWSAFTSAHANDGLLPRFLIFDAGKERIPSVKPTADLEEPPPALLRELRRFMDTKPAGNIAAAMTTANGRVKPIVAEWGEGAEALFVAMREEMEERTFQCERSGKTLEAIVSSRLGEHTIKLALIRAAGCDFARPVISVDDVEWARGVVEASQSGLLAAVEGRVSDNDRQAEYLKVLGIIRDAGAHGLLKQQLVKSLRGVIDDRRFKDIIAQLTAAGEIEEGMRSSPRGGALGHRVWLKVEQREAG